MAFFVVRSVVTRIVEAPDGAKPDEVASDFADYRGKLDDYVIDVGDYGLGRVLEWRFAAIAAPASMTDDDAYG